MAYFPDLSPYVYAQSEADTLNIGWLDHLHPFPTGAVPEALLRRLPLFHTTLVWNIFFGAHTCELCGNVSKIAEIRVFGTSPVVYAAPSMLMHYLVDHSYRPPDEFINAVLTGPTPLEEEYWVRAAVYRWSQAPGTRPPFPDDFISWLSEKCDQAVLELSSVIVTDKRESTCPGGQHVAKSAELIGREALYFLKMYDLPAQRRLIQEIHAEQLRCVPVTRDDGAPDVTSSTCFRITAAYVLTHLDDRPL
jgi:hypothetical protein